MPDALTVPMEVLRDGYWDGQYPRAGDVIAVPLALADLFELNGFAVRRADATEAAPAARGAKGSKHAR
jgi:hypothetical protein